MPQQSGLVPFLSARENVELGLRRSAGSSADPQRGRSPRSGLAERAGQRVSRLSAGEQVRVAVARALAARPALLLVDEPTARLDQANALRLATLLTTLARETRRRGRLRHARSGRDRAGRRRLAAGGGTGRSRLSAWKGSASRSSQLAARNHGMPLEALRYPVTPVGLHYLLIHYDVPVVEPEPGG